MSNDLRDAKTVNLAAIKHGYEAYRQLSQNPNLSAHEKIGFPDNYREGYEAAIFRDMQSKLPMLGGRNKTVLDIGPGCANLPRLLIDLCAQNGHRLILADSEEMLNLLPDHDHVSKVAGMFPQNYEYVMAACGPVDAIICYSVLHCMYHDANLFEVLDRTMAMLAPGGAALFGDIPNASKRKRFFSSETGIAFHKNFMKTDEAPAVAFNTLEPGSIDDAILSGLVQRCHLAGFDAYILPQPDDLPMANRREDLLIRRP